jgi:hypothetical protein
LLRIYYKCYGAIIAKPPVCVKPIHGTKGPFSLDFFNFL